MYCGHRLALLIFGWLTPAPAPAAWPGVPATPTGLRPRMVDGRQPAGKGPLICSDNHHRHFGNGQIVASPDLAPASIRLASLEERGKSPLARAAGAVRMHHHRGFALPMPQEHPG